jgi:hypothetical protein
MIEERRPADISRAVPAVRQAIRYAAFKSVARGCGFGGLAIITAMMGLIDHPPSAMKFAGCAALLSAAILILKAWRAPYTPYRKTEVWLLLEDEHKPSDPYAQAIVAEARIEAFYRFAMICAIFAAIFLTGGLLGGMLSRG